MAKAMKMKSEPFIRVVYVAKKAKGKLSRCLFSTK